MAQRLHELRALSPQLLAALIVAAIAQACGGQSVNETVCTPDETVCGGSCSALYKDPTNCGSCGNACSQGTVCFNGNCATSCGGGTIQCGQSCVDPNVDRDNCGACNAACPNGDVCVAAACGSTCADAQTLCVLDGGAAYCASTDSDNKNCGACGVACSAQLACVGGTCSSTCASGQTFCTSGDAGPYCATTASDNANCGGCGQACGAEQVCASGVCQSECSSTQTLCTPMNVNPYCADVSSDILNCGSCGNACSSDAYCFGGACNCTTGYTMCSATCVDLQSDTANCGACSTTCAGTCALGRCTTEVLTSVSGVYGLAVDGTNVYWSDSYSTYQTPKLGGSNLKLGTAYFPTVVTIDSTNVYWNEGGTGQINAAPIGGGTSYVVVTDTGVNSLVSDGTYVFYTNNTDGSDGTVNYVPVGGGAATRLFTYTTYPGAIMTSGVWIYWSDDYGVHRSNKVGNVEVTVTDIDSPGLATDGTNVYLLGSAGTASGQILSVKDDGSQLPIVLTSGQSYPGSPLTDGTYVYWFANGVCCGNAAIMRVPVGGGTPTVIADKLTSPFSTLAMDSDSLYWGATTSGYPIMRLTPR